MATVKFSAKLTEITKQKQLVISTPVITEKRHITRLVAGREWGAATALQRL
jgi:hypothetical protein